MRSDLATRPHSPNVPPSWPTHLFFLLSAFLGVASGALASPPTIAFEAQRVLVSGVTAGSQLAWIGVGIRELEFVNQLERRSSIIKDDDANGSIALEFPLPLTPRSIWAAVDLTSGEFSVAAPPGSELHEVSFPHNGIGATLNFLEDQRGFVELLVARPTIGAWALTAGDGGESDSDGDTNRSIRVDFDEMHPLGESPAPPDRLQPGDVVIVVDSMTFEFYAVRLAR